MVCLFLDYLLNMETVAAIAVIALAIRRYRARNWTFTVEDLMLAAGVVYVAGEFRETARRRLAM